MNDGSQDLAVFPWNQNVVISSFPLFNSLIFLWYLCPPNHLFFSPWKWIEKLITHSCWLVDDSQSKRDKLITRLRHACLMNNDFNYICFDRLLLLISVLWGSDWHIFIIFRGIYKSTWLVVQSRDGLCNSATLPYVSYFHLATQLQTTLKTCRKLPRFFVYLNAKSWIFGVFLLLITFDYLY